MAVTFDQVVRLETPDGFRQPVRVLQSGEQLIVVGLAPNGRARIENVVAGHVDAGHREATAHLAEGGEWHMVYDRRCSCSQNPGMRDLRAADWRAMLREFAAA